MPTRKNRRQRGGSPALNSWLWGVSSVKPTPAPHQQAPPASKSDNSAPSSQPQKGAGKRHKKSRRTRRSRGGLSSQLVPFGLTAAVLSSRKRRRPSKKNTRRR